MTQFVSPGLPTQSDQTCLEWRQPLPVRLTSAANIRAQPNYTCASQQRLLQYRSYWCSSSVHTVGSRYFIKYITNPIKPNHHQEEPIPVYMWLLIHMKTQNQYLIAIVPIGYVRFVWSGTEHLKLSTEFDNIIDLLSLSARTCSLSHSAERLSIHNRVLPHTISAASGSSI